MNNDEKKVEELPHVLPSASHSPTPVTTRRKSCPEEPTTPDVQGATPTKPVVVSAPVVTALPPSSSVHIPSVHPVAKYDARYYALWLLLAMLYVEY